MGGWTIPGVHGDTPLIIVMEIGAFALKTLFLIWLQMTIRWTLPRFRYDHIMRLGWRILLPTALVNLVVTGIILTFIERG